MRLLGLLHLVVVGLSLTVCLADIADNFWEDYVALIKLLDQYGHVDPTLIDRHNRNSSQISVVGDFDCKPSVSPTKPKSVNKLRPGDIDVIAALGDSLTAANGAAAWFLIGCLTEYRGLSASIGGDKTLDRVITLPNILKKYNRDIYGFSTGTGSSTSRNSKLNVAVAGGLAEDMPGQARELVKRMRNDASVDFETDWKIITIFIGGNDLCRQCRYPDRFSPENYVAFVEEAIKILSEIPRSFVNVIGMLEVYHINELSGFTCDLLHQVLCPCGMTEKNRETMKEATEQYQNLLQASITSGKFDRDDFATVFQTFFLDTILPRHKDGSPDYSFFAPDCFHFSTKAHGAQAIATWNNMIQPVGSKDRSWEPGETIRCPSEDFPYFYTNENSKPTWVNKEEPNQDEKKQEKNDGEQVSTEDKEKDKSFNSANSDDGGGLSGVAIALIVIFSVSAVVVAVAFAYKRNRKVVNPYQQL